MDLRVLVAYHEDLNFTYDSLLKLQGWRTTTQRKTPAKRNFKYNQMHRKTTSPFVYRPFKDGFPTTALLSY